MFLSSRRAPVVFTSVTSTLSRTLLYPFVTTSMAIKEEKKKEKRNGGKNETGRTEVRLTVCEEKMIKRSRN